MEECKQNEAKLVGDWEYIVENWKYLLKNNRKLIIRSLRSGIPDNYRSKVWLLLTNAEEAKRKSNFKYKDLLTTKPDEETLRIIYCDVPRTFPKIINNKNNKSQALRNILIAYANVDTEIGYVQGMNFIAAMFVLKFEEETAFWGFYSLMHLSTVPHRLYFTNNFPLLRKNSVIVDYLIEKKFPKVSNALKQHNVNSIIFVPHWFSTCFLNINFDPEMNFFIFDQFLAFGTTPLLSFGLTTISLVQNYLDQSFETFLTVCTNPANAKEMHNRQLVNLEWVNQWITSKEYKFLLKKFENYDTSQNVQ